MNKFFVCLALLPALLFGTEYKQQRMVSELEVIRTVFSAKYAPFEWKKAYCGWDLDDKIDQTQQEIAEKEKISTKEYQRYLKRFFNSTQDYHVRCLFHSTEAAYLPFRVKGAEGRYFVVWIDPQFLPYCPSSEFTEGVEIVTFDGKPIQAVIDSLKEEEFGQPDSMTDQSLAEAYLTLRIGELGQKVPSGVVAIEFLPAGRTDSLEKMQLQWAYRPEKIAAAFPEKTVTFEALTSTVNPFSQAKEKPKKQEFVKRDMATPLIRYASGQMDLPFTPPLMEEQEAGAGLPIGEKESFFPSLGEVVWESTDECPYQAYIFKSRSGKDIGYVRIPTFMADEEEAFEFEKLIHKFENTTSALVIDQMNNGGGDYFYLLALLSYLSDQPFDLPRERLTLTQEDIHLAIEVTPFLRTIKSDEEARKILGETWSGLPVDLQFVQGFVKFLDFTVTEWISGRNFTDPVHFFAMEQLKPNPKAHYTKPIAVLVNDLDFSCADIFPAILQDNGRAKLIGTKTAGAGGCVNGHSYPNLFGVQFFTYTSSIIERTGTEDVIENLGVTPDVTIELTQRDLQENYIDFVESLNDEIEQLL